MISSDDGLRVAAHIRIYPNDVIYDYDGRQRCKKGKR